MTESNVKTRSILRDVTLNLMVIVAVVASAIILVDYHIQKRRASQLLESTSKEYIHYLVQSLELPLWSMDYTSIRQICQAYFNSDIVEYIVIFDDMQQYVQLEKENPLPEISKIVPIRHAEKTIGHLKIGLSAHTRRAELTDVLIASLRNLLIVLLLLGVLTQVMLRYFLKNPLLRLTEMIKTTAEGRYQFDMEKPRHQELRDIFSRFEVMAGQVSAREQALRESATQLQKEIDTRILYEAEREQLIKELEERNAELERFTYTISHDLKSPLITIKGFLGYVRQSVSEGDWQRVEGDLNRISEAADRMNRLLGELLELSRIGRIENAPEAFALKDIADEISSAMAPRLLTGNVEFVVSHNGEMIYGDRIRIREVFENLVDNALKFMGPQSAPRVEIGAMPETPHPVFFVKDNGIGIEKKYRERIFTMFERLDPGVDGTGIGLAIVKRVVEVHGGNIRVESEGPGKGSTFKFTLPDLR